MLFRNSIGLRLALLVFLALTLLYLLPLLPPATMEFVDYYLSELVLMTALVALCVGAALAGKDRGTRRFWQLVAVAFGCWLAARYASFFLRDETPWRYDLFKDVLLLGNYCVLAVAVELKPGFIKSTLDTLRTRMAAASSVMLMIGVFGYFALVPALAGLRGYESPFGVYALLDAYFAVRFLQQAYRSPGRRWRLALVLIAAGFALISVADLLELAYRTGTLSYRPGQALNLVWFLFYLPLFAATDVASTVPQFSAGEDVPHESQAVNLVPLLTYTFVIPLIHLGGYGFGLLDAQSRVARMLFVLGWLALAIAVVAWQYTLLRKRLDAAVDARKTAESETLRLQSQLRQSQRLELMSQLTGGLAHEFGNSLFGAESFAQQILRDAMERRSDVSEERARALVGALAGSRQLIDKFRLLGRGDDPESSVVDAAREVRDTVELLKPGLPRTVDVTFHSDGSDAGVIARRQDLQQVTMNLVLNARDAIGTRGSIDVRVGRRGRADLSCASCGELVTGDVVCIGVSDSGPGVPAALGQRIFEPLVTTKAPGQGSGLGLSVVHTIVHQLGGHIAYGDPGSARCTFTVTLPAVSLARGELPGGPDAPAGHVLVVESDGCIAARFRGNPALHAMRVSCVASKRAAEVLLQQAGRPLDAVIIGNLPNPVDVAAIANSARRAAPPPRRIVLCAAASLRAIVANLDSIDTAIDQRVDDDVFAAAILEPQEPQRQAG